MGSFFSKTYGVKGRVFHCVGYDPCNFGRRSLPIRPEMVRLEVHPFAQGKRLDCHFGEDIHTADLGGDPEFGAVFFDPNDRRMAADPALLAGGQFRRED